MCISQSVSTSCTLLCCAAVLQLILTSFCRYEGVNFSVWMNEYRITIHILLREHPLVQAVRLRPQRSREVLGAVGLLLFKKRHGEV